MLFKIKAILKRNKLDENKLEENYKSFIKKNSEPVFRTVVRKAVMVLAKQFVFKAKMDEAVKFTNSEKYKRRIKENKIVINEAINPSPIVLDVSVSNSIVSPFCT